MESIFLLLIIYTEPTLLLALGKRVLDQIYYNNKAKLCEIRIRMMGVDVDLLHAIDHPIGTLLVIFFSVHFWCTYVFCYCSMSREKR